MNADIQQRINEGLAIAMGAKWVVLSSLPNKRALATADEAARLVAGGFWKAANGDEVIERSSLFPLPDYFANDAAAHQAKDALLKWLAADDARWNLFIHALVDAIQDSESRGILAARSHGRAESWKQVAMAFMLATPAEVAFAAALSLGIVDEKEIER